MNIKQVPGRSYFYLTLRNSLNKAEEKATVSNINPVLNWLNLFFAIYWPGWICGIKLSTSGLSGYTKRILTTLPYVMSSTNAKAESFLSLLALYRPCGVQKIRQAGRGTVGGRKANDGLQGYR
jgi:hypothetical protein